MFNIKRNVMLRDTADEGKGGGQTAGNLADALDAGDQGSDDKGSSDQGSDDKGSSDQGSDDKGSDTSPLFVGDTFDITTVPEKFVKDGKVDVDSVLAGFSELEKGQSKNDGIIGEVPETYEFTHPKIEGVDDDRIKSAVSGDDPIVKSFQEFAKGMNFTQKAHDEMMSWFVGASIEAQKLQISGEMETLGEKGAELVTNNSKFFKANLSEEGFKGIREAMVSARAVNALNEIRLAMGDTVIPSEGGDVAGTLTEQSLKDKMKLSAYWDPNHADYSKLRDEVEQGYKKLYKEP